MSRRGRPRPGTAAGVARWVVAWVVAACAAAGCTTETRRDTGLVTGANPRETRQTPPPRQSRRASAAPQPNDLTDPCAVRMHDLSGQVLLYYAVNKRLPGRVEELEAFADADTGFHADCPVSGRPYVYAPGGLQSSAGGDRYLILYDAVPAHGGLRWGVFVAPPREGQPPATWVILMSEEVFRGYVPNPGR